MGFDAPHENFYAGAKVEKRQTAQALAAKAPAPASAPVAAPAAAAASGFITAPISMLPACKHSYSFLLIDSR